MSAAPVGDLSRNMEWAAARVARLQSQQAVVVRSQRCCVQQGEQQGVVFSLCCPTSMVAEAAAAGHAAGLAVGQVRKWDRCVSLSDESEGGRSVQLQWLSAAAPAWGPDVAAGVYRFRQDRSFRLPGILQPAAPTGSGAAAEPVLQSSLVDLGVLALDWGQRLQLVHAQGQGLGQELRPWLRLQLQRNVVNVGGVRVGSCLLLLHCSVPSTYVPADLC